MKALVRAYLNNNFGDDLFIYILCKRYPNVTFNIIGEGKYSVIAEKIPNLRFIAEDSVVSKTVNKIYKGIQKIKKETVCNYRGIVLYNLLSRFFPENIMVTGSFFIQNPEWNEMLDAPWYDSRPHILGCNFGPYTDDKYYLAHKEQFKKAKEIYFRESFSCDLFSELKNIHYAPDLVFNLNRADYEIRDDGYYVVSVTNLEKDNDEKLMRNQEKYYDHLLRLISQITEEGKKVVLMSFCSEQGDDEVIAKLRAMIGKSDLVESFYYSKEGIERSLDLISHCRGVIATRYHAMILGFLFGKYVLPICYSRKMNNVLDDLGFTGERIDIREDIDHVVRLHEIKKMNEEKIEEVTGLSKKAFSMLDRKFSV